MCVRNLIHVFVLVCTLAHVHVKLVPFKVLVMVCLCCRCSCCTSCKCCCFGGRRSRRRAVEDTYHIPGVKHNPTPWYGLCCKKYVTQRRSASANEATSSNDKPTDVQSSYPRHAVSSVELWSGVPLDVDVVPLQTKPVTVPENISIPWIDAEGNNPDCCRQRRKPGFRPLRGSSAPA